MPKTNVDDFIEELGAGTFKEKLAHVLSEAALGTIMHEAASKKGKVTIEIKFARVGNNDQVIVAHKLIHSIPTHNGKRSEENETSTPMFVGKGGVLTINPPIEEERGQFSLKEVE